MKFAVKISHVKTEARVVFGITPTKVKITTENNRKVVFNLKLD